MKILRNLLIICAVIVLVVVIFWQYNRHMVGRYARDSVAQVYHIPQNEVVIEGVQELGFWRYKLNPFAYHSWSVVFTIPGGPAPSSGASYICSVDEPRFDHFKFMGIPVSLPPMGVKH